MYHTNLELHVGNGLRLNLRNTINGLQLFKKISFGGVPTLLPRAKGLEGDGHLKLKVKATSADQAVDSNVLVNFLDGGEVLIDNLGNCLYI